jgi:hypothetical protein
MKHNVKKLPEFTFKIRVVGNRVPSAEQETMRDA